MARGRRTVPLSAGAASHTRPSEPTTNHRPVFLTRRGTRVAAVVDADDLAALIEAAEDLADIGAARAARREMAETGESPIPWDDVKADLGLS